MHAVIRVSWSNGKGGSGKVEKTATLENFNWDAVLDAVNDELPEGYVAEIDGWKWED